MGLLRRWWIWAGIIGLVIWLIGSGPRSEPPAVGGPRTLTIAWIPKAMNNPIFELGYKGAVKRAAELSGHGGPDVQVLYVAPVAADAAEQVRIMEDVIVRGVDAIAISCIDPVACKYPIDKAVKAGIPVMTWDSDSPQSLRFTSWGIDNYRAGQVAAYLLVRAMGGRGKVALLTGVPGAYNLEERIRGFRSLTSVFPDIEIVAVAVSNEDINLGVQVVEETMLAHPDLNGWFFVGMWPLFAERGAMPLWESAAQSGRLKTVAFDTLPVELELLRDGYLSGLVGQKYWGWGYETVRIIYEHVVLGKQFPPFLDSGMDVVTRSNVDAMIRAWKTHDFSRPLPNPFKPDPFRPRSYP
ncbi:MAG: sugar ABC transporter substrate-binding protein [Chloroflexi bacterium]|nr:sugar ABC transporter substrate-binding protein [Chloroflexota bacterium]